MFELSLVILFLLISLILGTSALIFEIISFIVSAFFVTLFSPYFIYKSLNKKDKP